MSESTFLDRLEANNKIIKKDIMDSIKSDIKLANDETLKRVEEMFITFQTFILKNQSNSPHSPTTHQSNHQQPIYTVAPQACPQYYPPSPSFYSQAAMNQLHGFTSNSGANQPPQLNSVTQTPTPEPLTQEIPNEINPANA